MTPTVCALVPFRSIRSGKQRLCEAMGDTQRAQFVVAMLEDTLKALLASEGLHRVVLLSDDTEAAALARGLGAVSIAEAVGSSGLNAVVQSAARELSGMHSSLLIVHGDLPLLHREEVEQLLAAHHSIDSPRKLTIVPDRHRQGSNCILCTPPNTMRFDYGPGSLEKHLAFAERHDIQSQVVELPGASMDIDIPEDLAVLKSHELLASDHCVSSLLS